VLGDELRRPESLDDDERPESLDDVIDPDDFEGDPELGDP
jgi:hypothetical protein